MADEDDRKLAGSSGDDISAGTSVSGLGGEALRTADDETGQESPAEKATLVGWRKDAAEAGEQLVAGNDRTGQSERPPGGSSEAGRDPQGA